MSDTQTVSISTDDVSPDQSGPKPKRKKSGRLAEIRAKEPDFVGKAELAHHLGCHINTINRWIKSQAIPGPRSRPGHKHPLWLRKHYNVFVRTGEWPAEAFKVPGSSG